MKIRETLNTNKIKSRIEKGFDLLTHCKLCPHECGVNRIKNEHGFCRSGKNPAVSSFGPHFGEEPPLVGNHGSGTIFFTNCNLKCCFCQNYDISHLGHGREISEDELSDIMLSLQDQGCHNINLVTPTHFVPQILAALNAAGERGLDIPIVYNCGGYESVETLRILDGIIDIYMPDAKYGNPEKAQKYSGVKDYPEKIRLALKEMFRQVGNFKTDSHGIAVQGLIVRHLVMPNKAAGTEKNLSFIAKEISTDTYVNIMDQYHPEFKASCYPEINRRISRKEFEQVVQLARKLGLHRGFS